MGVEKRRCRRFQIPEGRSRYKKTGLLLLLSGYSKACPVTDVSKGGVSFECQEKFKLGQKVRLELFAPNEEPVILNAKVRRQSGSAAEGQTIAAVEFMPFGSRLGWNPMDTLDVLRRLDTEYGTHDE